MDSEIFLEECRKQLEQVKPANAKKRPHVDVKVSPSTISEILQVIKELPGSRHRVLVHLYRLPLVGFLLQWVVIFVRLPITIEKMRREIAQMQMELSKHVIESEGESIENYRLLSERLAKIESRIRP